MKKFLIIITVFLLLTACGEDDFEAPCDSHCGEVLGGTWYGVPGTEGEATLSVRATCSEAVFEIKEPMSDFDFQNVVGTQLCDPSIN